jgi:hypothetical protein
MLQLGPENESTHQPFTSHRLFGKVATMARTFWMRLLYTIVALSITVQAVEALVKRAMPKLTLPYATYEAAKYNSLTDVRLLHICAVIIKLMKNDRYTPLKTSALQLHHSETSAGRSLNHRSSSLGSRMALSGSFARRVYLQH